MRNDGGVPTLTTAQARRIAVAAQGFREPKPAGPAARTHLRRLISRIQVLQLDSVSVAVRAHYAPVFSRLGPYDRVKGLFVFRFAEAYDAVVEGDESVGGLGGLCHVYYFIS